MIFRSPSATTFNSLRSALVRVNNISPVILLSANSSLQSPKPIWLSQSSTLGTSQSLTTCKKRYFSCRWAAYRNSCRQSFRPSSLLFFWRWKNFWLTPGLASIGSESSSHFYNSGSILRPSDSPQHIFHSQAWGSSRPCRWKFTIYSLYFW